MAMPFHLEMHHYLWAHSILIFLACEHGFYSLDHESPAWIASYHTILTRPGGYLGVSSDGTIIGYVSHRAERSTPRGSHTAHTSVSA